MASIFICYSRDNEKIVERLASDVQALGHDAWFDQQLTGGQAWWDQILERIRLADAVAVALSPGLLESVACKREYSYALSLGKALLPVLVSAEVRTSLLPPALAAFQYVDYADPNREAVLRLGKALTKLPPPGALPDSLPDEPDVPMSYLGDLRERLETPADLDYGAQTALLLDLKKAVRDPQTGEDAAVLIEAFRKRPRLYANVAEELQELLDQYASGTGEADTGTATQLDIETSSGVTEGSPPSPDDQGSPRGRPETTRADGTIEGVVVADGPGAPVTPWWSSVRPSTAVMAMTLGVVLAVGAWGVFDFGAPPSAPEDAQGATGAEPARLEEAEPPSLSVTGAPDEAPSLGIDDATEGERSEDGSNPVEDDPSVELSPPTERASAESGEADRRALTAEVQEELVRLFLLPPPADGVAGPMTRAAVRDFQEWQATTVDGEIDQDLLASLRDVRATEPTRLGAGPAQPTRTHDVAPVYPPAALAEGVQGVVILEVVVGPSGRVADVKVLRSIPLLDDAAVRNVWQWRYTPTLVDGVPVPVILTETVNFRLTDPIVWQVYSGTGVKRVPLEGASVVLSDAAGARVGESTTGPDGEFRASLPDSEFSVTVTAEGHKTLRIRGVPGADVSPSLPSISLEMEPGSALEAVTRTWGQL